MNYMDMRKRVKVYISGAIAHHDLDERRKVFEMA